MKEDRKYKEKIQIVNWKSLDRKEKLDRMFFYLIGFPSGNFGCIYAIYKEYPKYSEQDAMDTFADWQVNNANGFGLSKKYEEELIEGARKDNRDEYEYIEESYIRAGNDGHYIEIPSYIEEISFQELKEKYHGMELYRNYLLYDYRNNKY